MTRPIVSAAALLLPFAAACGSGNPSTTPCTECIDVAGTYVEASTYKEVACNDGSKLSWEGWNVTLTLTQEKSRLSLSDESGRTLAGVLHDDHTVAFDSRPAFARNLNGGADEPGMLYFVGEFTETPTLKFAGTHTFVKDSDRCTIHTVVEWVKK